MTRVELTVSGGPSVREGKAKPHIELIIYHDPASPTELCGLRCSRVQSTPPCFGCLIPSGTLPIDLSDSFLAGRSATITRFRDDPADFDLDVISGNGKDVIGLRFVGIAHSTCTVPGT